MKIMLLFFLMVVVLSAQDVIPWGEEFRVSSPAESVVTRANISGLADGGFVVCWDSWNSDSTDYDIYVRRYDATGRPISDGFRANSYVERHQYFSDISGLSEGGFVVCWASVEQNSSDRNIYARHYDIDGNPTGNEFRVNTHVDGDQGVPVVTSLANGGFVVCWRIFAQAAADGGIVGRCYNKDGNPIGNDFFINYYIQNDQIAPSVSSLSNGGFVVSWHTGDQNQSDMDIYAQCFDSDGIPRGNEFRVNNDTEGNNNYPSVSSLTRGGFIICWQYGAKPDFLVDVHARRFDSIGNPIDSEFRVNALTKGNQGAASVASLSDGGSVVCWLSSNGDDGDEKIFARRFSEDGESMGSEFRVNVEQRDDKQSPRVSGLSAGGFVVCWRSLLQDNLIQGIWGKRFPADPLRHALESFELLQPKHDATIKTTSPRLNWQPASELTVAYSWELEYSVYYDTLADFNTASTNAVSSDTTVVLPVLKAGKTYFWKVLAKTYYGDSLWSNTSAFFISHTATGIEETSPRPSQFVVLSNYPNPFNPSTTIAFEIPQAGFVSIKIYDLAGRLVRTLVQEQKVAGLHSVRWDARDAGGRQVAAGVYLYQIEFTEAQGETMVLTRKMSLVK